MGDKKEQKHSLAEVCLPANNRQGRECQENTKIGKELDQKASPGDL